MRFKYKILIADDNSYNLEILKDLLEDHYTIQTTEDSSRVFPLLDEFNPDILLLDILMPGLDGYEISKQIRSSENFKFIKIIMVSGKSRIEERLKAYASGADDFIIKPFDEDELLAKINVFLRLKHAEEIDQMKTDILHLFSHETRTSLNGILSMAELLENSPTASNEDKEKAKLIHISGLNLFNYVKKSMRLCELKKGFALSLCEESLNTHLKKIMFQAEKNCDKKISFHAHLDSSLTLKVDWSLIDEALLHIIDNSIKYSHEHPSISVLTQKKDQYCQIKISDQGKGISPHLLQHIFNPLYIKDVLHHHEGHKLSLSITKKIIELHHGKIMIESFPKQGTEVTLLLPL